MLKEAFEFINSSLVFYITTHIFGLLTTLFLAAYFFIVYYVYKKAFNEFLKYLIETTMGVRKWERI